MGQKILCPCGSGLGYDICCGPYHAGKKAEDAMILMKSRYSAYAQHQYDYIISTTHPKSPLYMANAILWRTEIKKFSTATQFVKLEIFDYKAGPLESYVTFGAYLRQGDRDVSFKETSRFILENQAWFYVEGVVCPFSPSKNV